MKNKLSDLNNHLFEMLERLNDEDLTEEKLKQEVSRAGAIVSVSKTIIENASLAIKAYEIVGGEATNVRSIVGGPLCLD